MLGGNKINFCKAFLIIQNSLLNTLIEILAALSINQLTIHVL